MYMRILITDYGKYIPYGSSYYESLEFFNFLKNKGEDVDILKKFLVSPVEGSIDEGQALIRKYDYIVSYSPFDFDFIIKYIKTTKVIPGIIFIDLFNFANTIESKLSLFSKERLLFKKFVKILPYVERYVVVSEVQEDSVHRNIYGIDTIYTIPYAKERYFIKSDKIFRDKFVFTGRLNKAINNIDILLKAVNYIVKETDFLESHNLLCILTNTDDAEEVKNKIERMNLSEYFIFVPPIKNYQELLASLGFAVVLPAKDIRISNVIETMATGLPILMPDKENNVKIRSFSGGIKENIVEDGRNGLVYEDNDYKELAEKIMLMISLNEQTYMEMRHYASTYASYFSSKYEYQKIYDAMKEIYSEKTKDIQKNEFSKL